MKAFLTRGGEPVEFLVVRHSYGRSRRFWGLPGGGYKPARETPEEAVSREVREELGLGVAPETFTLLGQEENTTVEGKRDQVTTLMASVVDGSVRRSPEIAEALWVADLRDLEGAPVSRWLEQALTESGHRSYRPGSSLTIANRNVLD
ncbi:NUDIX domain-containing protein [Salininema proteolyticum]|uniref:NUDIX domain-containing protein n=1 Tax=Salininema proteolyticum TaxID=1607685 RepID=A0ABV8U3P2_9ACTN